MSKRKLPKGLQEFEGSLHCLEWTEGLLKRLRDLPGSDFNESLNCLRDALKVIEGAEAAAANARDAARRIAERAWKVAVKTWSIKELQKATGYDDE